MYVLRFANMLDFGDQQKDVRIFIKNFTKINSKGCFACDTNNPENEKGLDEYGKKVFFNKFIWLI